jgi:pilus assembly protein Flp/PilA
MNNFIKMLNDDSGASAAEYALILAIVGAGIALAAYTLGQNISNAMGAVGAKIGTCTAATPSTGPSGC